jgi:exodeoxyribonuclease V gamma subunit
VLHIHRAWRADALADALAELLATPLDDPFEPEIVSVPTRGVERWLTQRLAGRLGARPGRGDGICANIAFPFPSKLVSHALSSASELDLHEDPWAPERLVWPLLALIEECLQEPSLAALADHLGTSPARSGERRFGRVRRVAALYTHYDLRRGELLAAWSSGEDSDAAGVPLPAAAAWQPELWRRLRRAVGVPCLSERIEPACRRLRDAPQCAALPPRLSLFGLTALPPSHLAVLDALASARDVHLFVLHPSPFLWERIGRLSRSAPASRERTSDRTAKLARNQLLASWGHDSRELALVLERATSPRLEHQHALPEPPAATLLGALQADVRADRVAPGRPLADSPDTRPILRSDDLSVQIHACHGPARQVQVLRDAILHALHDDPTLEPRDVIVMCPDIEAFAPLISATFGVAQPSDDAASAEQRPGEHTPAALRVRLADRSLRNTNPLLAVLAKLLELASARLTASELLDFADAEPVRRRFSLDDDDLAQIRDWVLAAEIHWGLDQEHRAPYGLAHLIPGTWVAGLQRILLAVALGTDDLELFGGVLPIEELDSTSIDLAGRLAELIARLTTAIEALRQPQTLERWSSAAVRAIDMLAARGERDVWQRNELARLLDEVVAEAAGVAASATLSLADVRELLGERLAGRPTRANFRTGELTACTLVPMRSVPHRIVCLLGLDDGSFPRRSPRDGDDLLLETPWVGDRDPRTEDRQLLLDALMAAREQLIITYTGNDERTNAALPPAVVVGELLDSIDDTVRVHGGRARDEVVVRHPLQPFDPANFTSGRLRPQTPWSFDRVELAGARAMRHPRIAPGPMIAGRLPPLDEPTVALDDLVRFVERPVRAFVQQRLKITVRQSEDEVRDELPVALDGLAAWGVGARLLDGVLSGVQPGAVVAAEIARGTLPPGALGLVAVDRVWPVVQQIARAAIAARGEQPARSLQVSAILPPAKLLIGTVSAVHGTVLLNATFSRLQPRHRLASWVRLLALSAAHPEQRYEAVMIGRGDAESDTAVLIARVPMLAADPDSRQRLARTLLEQLLDLRTRGLREPLPLPPLAAAAYAQSLFAGAADGEALAAAQALWRPAYGEGGEDAEPEHRLAFGEALRFAELLERMPLADERGQGWAEQATSRFARCARRLWDPLLERELIETR